MISARNLFIFGIFFTLVMAIELGGHITLDGAFSQIEPASLVIVKKMAGNYAKDISTNICEFENLSLALNENSKLKEIVGEIKINGVIKSCIVSDSNLFFALDRVLADLKKQSSL